MLNCDEGIMRIKRNTVTLLLVAIVILYFGFSGVAGADARRGEHFSERWCSQCHGVRSGQASPYASAPSFSDLAANPATTRDSLIVSLRTTPHWTMPKIKLKSADINDVVSYILSLRNPR
jgi:mono/diheme cytochrome c family protein